MQKVDLPTSFTKLNENCGLPDFFTDYQIRHLGNPSGLPGILLKIDPCCNVKLSYIYMGTTTFALHLSEGTTPVSSDVLKIMVRIGAISIASCLNRIIGLILSGHAALCGFKFCSNLRIPSSFTCISGISGYGIGSML